MSPMIKRINKIKNLGLVYRNYSWDSDLPSFKQCNLVYGWNGSGKTSLARLFDALGTGVETEDLEYEIEDAQGNKYKQGDVFPKKVRVFNHDYIQSNVKILESRANSISVLLGEENKEWLDKIESDRKLLSGDSDSGNPGKIGTHDRYVKDKKNKSTERDGKFTEIAKTIGAAIGGNALRDYRKPQAEMDFASLSIKVELSTDDLQKCSVSAKQESVPVIDLLTLRKMRLDDGGQEFELPALLDSIKTEAEMLLGQTVESKLISRLAENEDISEWVERGVHLHRRHVSDVCEYCLQKIPATRIEQLARHFNEADKKLKDELDVLIGNLMKICHIIESLQLPDRSRFYPELRNDFDLGAANFNSAKQEILSEITKLVGELKSKKSKTTEAMPLVAKPQTAELMAGIGALNNTIATHNQTTADFDVIKREAIKKLKLHYLSTIFDDIKHYESEITTHKENIELLETEIKAIRRRIADNMAKISSKHKACEDLNKKLATFLGHTELTFVPDIKKETDDNGEEREVVIGYNIIRCDKPALYLSEGEKTAIGFVYFVVHLGDQDFKVSDGVIVVDDPISSLDSNSLYQAFAFLKNAVNDAAQVFVFTHSFEFLKLLINWRRGAGGAGYYMIKNNFIGDARCAYIDKMDKELCEYESEYHYLFKLLKKLRDEQDDSIARAYPVPNIARKLWDTFLMFSVPNGKSSYKKMDELKEAGHDEQKLDAIYKFTNSQSHITGSGFDPALVPETKKVVKSLFEMMERIAPDHFRIIDRATN